MQNRQQLEDQLRQETRDQIFNRQIADALEVRQREAAEGTKTYSEKVDHRLYTSNRPTWGQDPVMFKVEGDDKFKTKTWEAMMSDCAFYFDRPSMEDESKMKKTLMTKYDNLFPSTAMKPTLQSRKDLVGWACLAQNAYMQSKDAPAASVMNCEKY